MSWVAATFIAHEVERRALPRLDAVEQQPDAVDRAVRPLVVRGREAGRRLVVPVDDLARGRVDRVRVPRGRQEPSPVVLPGADRRQAGIDPRRSDRQPAARHVRNVLRVDVEAVEDELEALQVVDELLRRRQPSGRQVVEAGPGAQLAPAGRPILGKGDAHAADRPVPEHRPVHGVVEGHRRRCRVRDEAARVEARHRRAGAAVDVVEVVAAAEGLGEGVDVVGVRRRERPAVVGPAADQHVRDAGQRAAAHRHAAALQVDLPEELGIEVAELRPGDHDRMPGRRA
jgi:hypothetical protein